MRRPFPSASVSFASTSTVTAWSSGVVASSSRAAGGSFTSITVTITRARTSPPWGSRARTRSSYRFGSDSKSSPGPTYRTTPSRAPIAKSSRLPDTSSYVNSSPSGSVAVARPNSTGLRRPSRFSCNSK